MMSIRPESDLHRFLNLPDWNPPPAASPPRSSAVVGETRYSMAAAAYSETLQLEIVTREGDRVAVDVRQMMAGLASRETRIGGYADGSGVAVVASRDRLEAGAFEARFGLYVEGDLNDEEMAALKRIFTQVGRLADQFFQGDMQAVVRSAQRLKVDGDQIGALDLEMSQRITQVSYQRRAVAAYAAVAQTRSGPPPLQAARQVDRYWSQVEQVQATIQQTFRSFNLSIETLMGGGDQRTVSAIEETHRQIEEMVDDVRELLGAGESDVVDEAPEEPSRPREAATERNTTAADPPHPAKKPGLEDDPARAAKRTEAVETDHRPAAPDRRTVA